MADAPPLSRPRKAQAAAKATGAKKAAAKAADGPRKKPANINAGNGTGGRPSKAQIIAKIQNTIEAGGGALMVAGGAKGNEALVYDGKVITYQAPKLASEIYDLSLSNEFVRKGLESFYSTGRQLDSLTAILGTVIPIFVAHGRLPAQALAIPGVGAKALTDAIGPPPERLASVTPLRAADPLDRSEAPPAEEVPTVEVPWAGARAAKAVAKMDRPPTTWTEAAEAPPAEAEVVAAREAQAEEPEVSSLGVSLADLSPGL